MAKINLRVRKKSRFNTADTGNKFTWKHIHAMGCPKPRMSSKQKRKRKASFAVAHLDDARRQYQDRDLNWDKVALYLGQGMSLDDAKSYVRKMEKKYGNKTT